MATLKPISGNGAWFVPDRIENFTHDAPENFNMVVYDAAGVAVCGRVVEAPVGTWVHRLTNYLLE